MDLRKLKNDLMLNICPHDVLIFKDTNNFLSNQYINKLSEIKKASILYIDDINILRTSDIDIFSNDTADKYLYIYKIDKLDKINEDLIHNDNLIILAKNIDKEIINQYDKYIVIFPDLENWQIIDYIKCRLPVFNDKNVTALAETCKYDIFRIDNEIDKILLFNDVNCNTVFSNMVDSQSFDDTTNNTIFTLTDCIITKNINKAKDILLTLDKIDMNPIALTTILYNNFKNIINIQLDPQASADKLSMNPRQFAALKYKIGHYSKDSLIDIFRCIADIDFKIKSGKIDINKITDYLIINILGA